MSTVDSRRDFLWIAPLAAAISVVLPKSLHAAIGAAASAPPATNPVPFQVFKAETLAASEKTLEAAPGTKSLIDVKDLPVTVVMTTETAKAAKEFEWHEGRDHVVQILDGSTMYELGGTPKNGRNTKPQEWLAPESEGCSKVMLGKGDMLLIPRSTPHKRTTTGSVAIILISTVGTVTS
ncbi:hypothetical protein [Granulicella sibirica]|uniref:Cupin n=1 Tax=Granulicella sibirica TaxID=2479048 RepID=A0A4V1L552_9BACT|nr:hypothetical protein [Granulicella sibirica]RXH54554.1 hypothetical protein GRAN_3658 [Granulicella sibirica]